MRLPVTEVKALLAAALEQPEERAPGALQRQAPR